MSLRHRTHAGSMVFVFLLATLLGSLAIPGQQAAAQRPSGACDEMLKMATEAYHNQSFDRVVALVSWCTDPSVAGEAVAIESYRLMAMSFLRQEQSQRAWATVANILAIDSSYTGDPTTDSPWYTKFVSQVREEIKPSSSEPPAPSQSAGVDTSFFAKVGVGVSDYTGDWPAEGGHPFDFREFDTGNGLPLLVSMEVGYHLTRPFSVSLGYQGGNYPHVGYSGPTDEDSYRHTFQLLGRYTFVGVEQRFSPYLDAGVNLTAGGANAVDAIGIGYGPVLGGGVEISFRSSTSFFVEYRFNAIFPDEATDGHVVEERSGPFDMLSQLLGFGTKVYF